MNRDRLILKLALALIAVLAVLYGIVRLDVHLTSSRAEEAGAADRAPAEPPEPGAPAPSGSEGLGGP